jgi:hypothetical protein
MSRMALGAALTFLIVAGSARASSWGYSTSGYYSSGYYPSYYYAPAPVVRYYAPVLVYVQPAPMCAAPLMVMPSPYARPFAAPPSSTREPPLDKKSLPPPKVTESRSYPLTEDKSLPAVDVTGKGVCRVGFWNITGRDVTLSVNGKAVIVPANRNVTLSLGRQFSWQMEGQTAHDERVPEDKAAHEIVLR